MRDYKLDLHTHSIISYDGGITESEYARFLADKKQFVAITDHDEISFALELSAKLGEQVIVGEEINTLDGEIIGLYLKEKITPGLSAVDTCDLIHAQGGVVYIPHPLETWRRGLQLETLQKIIAHIDILEAYNARLRQSDLLTLVKKFAQENSLVIAASSDAHGEAGLRTSYTEIDDKPTKENILAQLRAGSLVKKQASWGAYLDPLKNKIRKAIL